MDPITIEIDCAPGNPRPGDLFPGTIADTGLTEDDFEITSKLFGNWTWQLTNEAKRDLYEQHKEVIGNRIRTLSDRGQIRYGSWD